MIFFCDSGGNIFNVIPSHIYQGSAGANTIRFVGQFPTSSQVLVAYKLPNGIYTQPKYMTRVDELEEVQAPNGGKFSVWESVIGATPKYDDQGNQVYELDYAVTEHYGEVTVQFYVYGPMQQGGVTGTRLATASSSFTVEKGVPVILEVSNQQSYEDLLEEILYAFSSIEMRVGNLETWQSTADQDITELQNNLGDAETDIGNLRSAVETNEGNITTLQDDVSSLRQRIDDNSADIVEIKDDIDNLSNSIDSLDAVVTQIDEVTIPAINARIDLQEQVIKQSGLQYTQDITQEYQTRETANGKNVLNGSTAILKTVVGKTIATSNQLNLSGVVNSYFSVNDNGKEIKFLQNASYVVSEIGIMQALCPYIHIGDTIYLYETSGNMPNGLVDSSNVTVIPLNTATVVTSAMLSKTLHLGINPLQAGAVLSNLQITKKQNSQWYPFFFGLKSAGFSGFTSSKADSTSPNWFNFSFEQMPLGKTIDFEQKKFVERTSGEIVLTGTENWEFYRPIGQNSVLSYGYSSIDGATGVCTDAKIATNNLENAMRFYIGAIIWFGILDNLGFTTAGVEPTTEEKTAAVNNFKAYLAQRYARGNPVTIRYVTPTGQTETPFSSTQEEVGNTYTAYLGGIETVNGNSDAEYGAENTLTQNYVLIKEV